ncbi:hypothetical protein D3C74_422280 [compost metagenome]
MVKTKIRKPPLQLIHVFPECPIIDNLLTERGLCFIGIDFAFVKRMPEYVRSVSDSEQKQH